MCYKAQPLFFAIFRKQIRICPRYSLCNPKTRNMKNFDELIQSPSPVLVDFYAEWCMPCKMMLPILLEVEEEMEDKARFLKVDVDKEKELAKRFRILSVPTLIIFKNGEQLWRQSGVMQKKALTHLLKEYL